MEKQLELDGIYDAKQDRWEIALHRDNWAESPREWDNLGKIFVGNRCQYVRNEMTDLDFSDWSSGNKEEDREKLEKMGYLVYPLSVYDHSGWTIRIAEMSGWDCGMIGWYLIDKEQAKKDWKWKKLTRKRLEHLDQIAESEIKTLDDWAQGNVWEFTLFRNDEEVDTCGGFYGDEDEVLEQMYEYFPSEFTNAFSVEEAEKFVNVID